MKWSRKYCGCKTQDGSAATLQNKYIGLHDGENDAYYAWINVNSEGVDPAPGGTGIAVTLSVAATATAVATALASALDGDAEFETDRDGLVVKVTNADKGSATDISAGNSGFTVETRSQGDLLNILEACLLKRLAIVQAFINLNA